jgi:hypothetical protein
MLDCTPLLLGRHAFDLFHSRDRIFLDELVPCVESDRVSEAFDEVFSDSFAEEGEFVDTTRQCVIAFLWGSGVTPGCPMSPTGSSRF